VKVVSIAVVSLLRRGGGETVLRRLLILLTPVGAGEEFLTDGRPGWARASRTSCFRILPPVPVGLIEPAIHFFIGDDGGGDGGRFDIIIASGQGDCLRELAPGRVGVRPAVPERQRHYCLWQPVVAGVACPSGRVAGSLDLGEDVADLEGVAFLPRVLRAPAFSA